MEKRPTGPPQTNQQQPHNGTPPQSTSMSMLTMTASSPHAVFKKDYAWDALRSPDYSRPATSSKPIALPSIRQAFPELNLSAVPLPSDSPTHPPSATTSPNPSGPGGPLTSPEYALTSSGRKRRRSSLEEASDPTRPRQAPRILGSPEYALHHTVAPSAAQHAQPIDTWPAPGRPAPYSPKSYPLAPPAAATASSKYRASLPPLPGYDRRPAEDEYHPRGPPPPPAADYSEPGYGYSYLQPSRYQHLPSGASRGFDRPPFPKETFDGVHRQDLTRYGELGGMGGDKHRKRRGNLPKETTDKLRSWFLAHLSHPYPTEDEKQDLMRQTGLQMNQISNWFINARRRQLPTMINNARAEADVMSSRSSLKEGQHSVNDDQRNFTRRDSRNGHYSEGESVTYEDELDRPDRRGNLERGSV